MRRRDFSIWLWLLQKSKACLKLKMETKSKKEADKAGPEARVILVADSNIISDGLLQSRANQLFMIDGLNWLVGREKFSGEQSSEEDVKIEHSRKEDILWFNSTILGMPIFILAFAYSFLRRRRRIKAS